MRFDIEEGADGTLLRTEHEFPPGDEYRPFVNRYLEAWPRALARLPFYLDPNHRDLA